MMTPLPLPLVTKWTVSMMPLPLSSHIVEGPLRCVHTEWWQRERYRSPCEHPHSFTLNPFRTTPLLLPLQCERFHLIAFNPFIGNDIVAVVVTQCEHRISDGKDWRKFSISTSFKFNSILLYCKESMYFFRLRTWRKKPLGDLRTM